MRIRQFLFGSIDDSGYNVHFLPVDLEEQKQLIYSRFKFFGGITKQNANNIHTTAFKVKDNYVIASYTISGEDTLGRKDVLIARGVLMDENDFKSISYNPFQITKLLTVLDFAHFSAKDNFSSELTIEVPEETSYFKYLSDSIRSDNTLKEKIENLIPGLWAGKKVRLIFSEENIWLIELLYALSPKFFRREISYSTLISSHIDNLVFTIALSTNSKELSDTSKVKIPIHYRVLLGKIYDLLLNGNTEEYNNLIAIKSFDEAKPKDNLVEKIIRVFKK